MDLAKLNRALAELDKLEKRIRMTVNPSKVLLDQIEMQREKLLNPKGDKK